MTTAKDQVQNVTKQIKDDAGDYLQEGQEWLQEADSSIRDAMREHPAACLFVALGLGYAIGRLIAKR